MGKRRHQSSSVEEVSPVVIKRTSSRLTRSKKLKATTKSSSPVLGKVPVSRVSNAAVAGSTSKIRINPIKSTRRRISDVQRLIELDCQTPVRPHRGRSSHVQFNSPHSESEPEIIWDDKSPNAVQPRRLGKAGKRNAVEDISDIINCVPEVAVDTSNVKPSLLSFWMTRDSPSPKEQLKYSEESNGQEKKKVDGKKKARKSRLSALTHELEKVLNAIEPEEGDIEEEEEPTLEAKACTSAAATSTTDVDTKVSPPTLYAQTSNNKNAVLDGRHSPPTLYTQTKPAEQSELAKPIPLPALGFSPDSKCQSSTMTVQRVDTKLQRSDVNSKRKDNLGIEEQEKQLVKEDICKGSLSDDSPPGSQSKWQAIGNESAEDLWGDDDMFEDDGLLMKTIEVEIASSQVPSSTPLRKINKKQTPNGTKNENNVKETCFRKPQLSDNISTAVSNSYNPTKQTKMFVAARCSTSIPKSSSLSASHSTFSKSDQASQKMFVPHRTGTKTGFQPFKPSASIGSTDSQKLNMPGSNASGVASYSLRSGNKTSGSSQPHKFPIAAVQRANKGNLLCKNTSVTASCVTRTSPPNVTRVVYSTSIPSTTTNSSVATRSQTSKFVPFKPELQSKTVAPTTASSSALYSKSQNCRNTVNQTTTNNVPSFQKHMPESSQPVCASQQSKSKVFQPYQKPTSSTISAVSQPQGGNQPQSQTSSKVYVPYNKASQSNASQRHYQGSTICSKKTALMASGQTNVTQVNSTKTYTPLSLSQAKPFNHGGHNNSVDTKSKAFVPFKKPQTLDQYKSCMSSSYVPAIPSQSDQFQQSSQNSSQSSMPSSQNMDKSVVFGKVPIKSSSVSTVASSKTFVRHNSVNATANHRDVQRSTASLTSAKQHIFVRANTSQSAVSNHSGPSVMTQSQNYTMQNKSPSIAVSQSCTTQKTSSSITVTNKMSTNKPYGQLNTNPNLAGSKCSNNNVNLGKVFSSNQSKPSGGLSSTGSNQSVKRRSTGAGPDSMSSGVVDGGQFDESLPDEMLLSVMDGSWDEF